MRSWRRRHAQRLGLDQVHHLGMQLRRPIDGRIHVRQIAAAKKNSRRASEAAFLVISLRQRLLALSAQHARELLNVADEREMALRLDAIVRDALSEIADLPLK